MQVWRISEFTDLSGRGGELYPGRWNHTGDAIVYCAEHPALALLEVLVNLDLADLPETLQLIRIDIPVDVAVFDAPQSPSRYETVAMSRDFWAEFVTTGRFAVLKVPSVIMPHCSNYLINPKHADAQKIEVASTERFTLDPRFTA